MSAVKAPRPPILKKEGTLQRPLKVRLETPSKTMSRSHSSDMQRFKTYSTMKMSTSNFFSQSSPQSASKTAIEFREKLLANTTKHRTLLTLAKERKED